MQIHEIAICGCLVLLWLRGHTTRRLSKRLLQLNDEMLEASSMSLLVAQRAIAENNQIKALLIKYVQHMTPAEVQQLIKIGDDIPATQD